MFAVRKDDVEGVDVHTDELNHLERREVLFPPDISCMVAHKVIHVHDHMNRSIQHDCHVHITVVRDTRVHPIEQKRRQMMVDMQKRQLVPLLARDDEKRIEEIKQLGHIEYIQHVSHHRVDCIIRHTAPGVVLSISILVGTSRRDARKYLRGGRSKAELRSTCTSR